MTETIDKQLIPKHWQIKKLGEVCDKISLNGIKIKQKDYLSEGKYPVIDQGQDLIGGYYNDESLIVPSEPPYVIFGDHTKVKKYINFKFIAGADGVKVLKPHKIFDSKFFFYLIHTVKIPDKGYARHFQFLEKEEIPLPPLPEQQAIVTRIEELFSHLENGKQQLQTAQQQLKVYRQSLLKAAFEGKLTAQWREQQKNNTAQPASKTNYITPETIDAAAEPTTLYQTKEESIVGLPEGWKLVEMKEVIEVNPKIPNRENISPDLEVQFIPMKLVEQIVNKIHLNETRKYSDVLKGSYTPFINGDILFAKVTPCMENGKIAIAENLKNGIGFGSSEFHIARCSKIVLNSFIFYFIVQDKFRIEAANEMTGAVGLRRVPKQFIENYSIPLPPLPEQQLIIDELESKLTICDKIEETISQSLQQAEVLRQSILKKAFEGRLVNYECSITNCK